MADRLRSGSADPIDGQTLDTRLLAKALTIRRVEERLLDLFSQGKLTGTVHTCIGQEWVGVAVAEQLRPGDYIVTNHRGHGHYLAWTDDVEGLIAELMGRSTGVCGGRGGSQHLCRDGLFSNGIQGGMTPIAAGLALACALDDSEAIAAAFIGDGTLGEGVVYETLNIASKWRLPLLIVVEDNGIAQSTEQARALSGTIAGRADAFAIEYRTAGTDDPPDLIETAREAATYVRTHREPILLHVHTQRLKAHSKGDDTREPDTVTAMGDRDVLNQVLDSNSTVIGELDRAITHRIDDAIGRAESAPAAGINIRCPGGTHDKPVSWQPLQFASRRAVDAIRQTLQDAMRDDERVVLLGEDIGDPYGGAFKVTAGLSRAFPDRVRSTPISEAAIIGLANGLALGGRRPIAEIMFGDFILLAADQLINHAAKFAWMYNDQVQMPMIVRTPMGGYRGYGPTHSQSLEKHLLGVPGLQVVALHHRCCPGMLYRSLLSNLRQPTVVIENKTLYGQMIECTPPAGMQLTCDHEPLPTVRLSTPGHPGVTVVACGGIARQAEAAVAKAYADEELACELLMPTQLYPFHVAPLVESVRHTGRLLVIEEGQGFAGLGSELISQLACRDDVPAFKADRICATECPIPAAKSAEQQVLPDAARILAAITSLALR